MFVEYQLEIEVRNMIKKLIAYNINGLDLQ